MARSDCRCASGSIGDEPSGELLLALLGDDVEPAPRTFSRGAALLKDTAVTGKAGQRGVDLTIRQRLLAAEGLVVFPFELVDVAALARALLQQSEKCIGNTHKGPYTLVYTLSQYSAARQAAYSLLRLHR